MLKNHKKGCNFETIVAQYFREIGYRKVLLRERICGKSGIKHEIDVLVFDNLDQNKKVWACQCKYWNKKIGINQIKEWIETCKDIGVRPAFAGLKFSSKAKEYARKRGVWLITINELRIKPSQIFGKDFLSWRKEFKSIKDDMEKIIFLLKSIYKTEILQNAEEAKKTRSDELRYFKPELYKLFIDPNDQRLTKFLYLINVDPENLKSVERAFGPPTPPLFRKDTGEGLSIPNDVGKVAENIRSILKNVEEGDLEPFKIDWDDKCRIFLECWLQLAKVDLLQKICDTHWYTCQYACKNNKKQGDPNLDYDREKRILIGKPIEERWKRYFYEKRKLWKTILKGRSYGEIKKLSNLFQTDLSVINEEDKLPNIKLDKNPCLICEIFSISKIITKAYEKNKSKVEEIIFELKSV